jgi:hypothetical protein
LKTQAKTNQASAVNKMNNSQVRSAARNSTSGMDASQRSSMRMNTGAGPGRR